MIYDDNDKTVQKNITTGYGTGKLSITGVSAPTIIFPHTAGTIQVQPANGTSGHIPQTYYGTTSNTTTFTGQTIVQSNINNGYTFAGSSRNTVFTGDAEFEGDIKIKGVSLSERFDKIEQLLGILRPNEELEEIWTELKELGDRYRELEKDILEKQAVWDILKK